MLYNAIIAKILPVALRCMDSTLVLKWWQIGILAGQTLRDRQCTLEGRARYVNV